MSDTLEMQLKQWLDSKLPTTSDHMLAQGLCSFIRAREQAARLEEAEWWEHLVPSDHDEEGKSECLYCQRLAALRASREPEQ